MASKQILRISFTLSDPQNEIQMKINSSTEEINKIVSIEEKVQISKLKNVAHNYLDSILSSMSEKEDQLNKTTENLKRNYEFLQERQKLQIMMFMRAIKNILDCPSTTKQILTVDTTQQICKSATQYETIFQSSLYRTRFPFLQRFILQNANLQSVECFSRIYLPNIQLLDLSYNPVTNTRSLRKTNFYKLETLQLHSKLSTPRNKNFFSQSCALKQLVTINSPNLMDFKELRQINGDLNWMVKMESKKFISNEEVYYYQRAKPSIFDSFIPQPITARALSRKMMI